MKVNKISHHDDLDKLLSVYGNCDNNHVRSLVKDLKLHLILHRINFTLLILLIVTILSRCYFFVVLGDLKNSINNSLSNTESLCRENLELLSTRKSKRIFDKNALEIYTSSLSSTIKVIDNMKGCKVNEIVQRDIP